jgi:hypothetical protein
MLNVDVLPMKLKDKGCMLVALLPFLLVGTCRMLSVYETKKPLNLARAIKSKYIKIPPPSTASYIWVLSDSLGPGTYNYLLRFNAPVEDCIKYAESVISRNNLMAENWTKTKYPSTLSGESDSFVNKYHWWDRNKIKNGITWDYDYTAGESGPSIYESVYVDIDRGILYYFSGD